MAAARGHAITSEVMKRCRFCTVGDTVADPKDLGVSWGTHGSDLGAVLRYLVEHTCECSTGAVLRYLVEQTCECSMGAVLKYLVEHTCECSMAAVFGGAHM